MYSDVRPGPPKPHAVTSGQLDHVGDGAGGDVVAADARAAPHRDPGSAVGVEGEAVRQLVAGGDGDQWRAARWSGGVGEVEAVE